MLKYSSEQYVTEVPAMPSLLLNNRVSMREVTGLHQYGYDKLHRLTTVDYPRYPDQAYSYDPSGNRLTLAITGKDTQTYTYNPANSLKDVTEGQKQTTYEWDKAGNLKTQAESAGGKTEYAFDGANRLAGATLPSGQSLTYGYDTDGHRVYRKEGDEKTWFVFDGLSVVMELDKDRKASAAIVPGLSKTNLSYHIPVTEFFIYDGLGSVVMLTDVLGNPTQYYQYDVFGGTQNLRRDPFNKYRFVGLAQDDSLGLTYMNARWYDAGVGRFLSVDPVPGRQSDTQSLNSYLYVGNNPIGMIDRNGKVWWNPFTWFEKASDKVDAKSAEKEAEAVSAYKAGRELSAERTHQRCLRDEERNRVEKAINDLRADGFGEQADRLGGLLKDGQIGIGGPFEKDEAARTRNPIKPQEFTYKTIRLRKFLTNPGIPINDLGRTLAHEAVHVGHLYEGPYVERLDYATFWYGESEDKAYDLEIMIGAKQGQRMSSHK